MKLCILNSSGCKHIVRCKNRMKFQPFFMQLSKKLTYTINILMTSVKILLELLIDRNMMKKDLIQLAGISTNAMAKMGKGGDVSTQVLRKICIALDCKIEDIVEIIPDESVFLDI